MNKSNLNNFTRRDFLSGTGALGAASLFGWPEISRAEPPPETKKLRLVHAPAICLAPQYLAEELFRLEGFSEIEYVDGQNIPGPQLIADGKADISMWETPSLIPALDQGKPITLLAGVHAGCYELFGNDSVHAIRDLKGKTVAVFALGGGDHILVSSMLAYVGIDPNKHVRWISGNSLSDAMRLFVDGKADAFMGFAPQPQELRLRKIGHVIVNTAQDKPWSQYFCCQVMGNRDWVRKNPTGTKRALRAILKSADICASNPQRVARYLKEKGIESRYEIALDVLQSLPYARWRDANPEDTLRFHALRLHEVGMIKTHPNKLIAQGTDWRFLNEIKSELKA